MTTPLALPPGLNHERLILWDRNFRPVWDSAAANRCAAYDCINGWIHATIDHPDGTRWFGQLYRCREGVKRWSFEDIERLTNPPNPIFDQVHDHVYGGDE